MRIGYSIASLERGEGGLDPNVVSLVRGFVSHAPPHEFFLFVLEDDLPALSFARNQMQLVPVSRRFRPPLRNFFWHQLMLPRLASRLRLDVLHIPNFRRMLWQRPCPMVTTIDDPGPRRSRKNGGRTASLFDRQMVRWLATRQDEIIVTSDSAAENVATQFGISTRCVSVVCNGVDHTRFFAEPPQPFKAAPSQSYEIIKPFFLYVAPLEHPAGNHLRLIKAFEDFKSTSSSPWQLVLAGADSRGADVINRAISNSRFTHDIRCVGQVTGFDLPKLYRAAGVVIHPALYDGLGTAPLEAMASGCPVISSDRGALKEILGRSAAIIDPESPAEMTANMIRMAGDPELRSSWSLAGLARAKCFQWQKTASGTIEVYSQAMTDFKMPRSAFAMAH